MRTIASTFSNREQAEQASRRLLEIGVAPDRILLKELPEVGGGVFISAKVAPEQVGAVTEILKSPPPALEAPAVTFEDAAAAPVLEAAEARAVPLPPGRATTAPRLMAPATERNAEVTRYGRYIVIFCLILVLAFIAGAMLGLVT